MTDLTYQHIRAEVRERLAADPRLPYPGEIAVEAYGGAVSLRGTVGSFAQRRAAVADARQVEGVFDVEDEIEVRLLTDDKRRDAEIRGAALQSLIWDTRIPGDLLEARVLDGWVTLNGDVDFQFQSDAAFEDVASMHGVTGVTNEIRVIEPRFNDS